MQKREINFGIIGCGLMGREFASAVARWCHLLDQDVVPHIIGVCDTNPAMLGWFTEHFDTICIATQDYHELLDSFTSRFFGNGGGVGQKRSIGVETDFCC